MTVNNSVLEAHTLNFFTRPGMQRSMRIYGWLSASVALYQNHVTGFFVELALNEALPVLKIKEVILQNYLFCGFPNAIEGLLVFNRKLHDRHIKDDNFFEVRDADQMYKDGIALCQRIYGSNFEKLIKNMERISVDVARWMVNEGYAKVLSRSVLSPIERELCVVAALAALQRERQLISHIRGALHVGAQKEEITEVIEGLRVMVPHDVVSKMQVLTEEIIN